MQSGKKFEHKSPFSAARPQQDQITNFQLYQIFEDSLEKNELKYAYRNV